MVDTGIAAYTKHIIWIIIVFVVVGMSLHFFGLPTPLEFTIIFLQAFGLLPV